MLTYEMESWKSLNTCLIQDGNETTILSHHPYVDLAPFSQLRTPQNPPFSVDLAPFSQLCTPQNPPFSGEGVVC